MPNDALSFTVATSYDGSGINAAAQGVAALGGAATGATAPLKAAGDAGNSIGTKTAAGAKDATEKLSGLAKEAHGFIETLGEGLAGGFSAGLGIGAAEKVLGGLEEIVTKVKEAFVEGVKGNAELETQTLSLAATLRSVEPERYLSFEAAKGAAVDALATIRAKAVELGQDSHAIIETFGATQSALIEAGVRDVGKQVELTTTLLSAATSKGINGARAMIDVIDILNNKGVERLVLAKELGLTSENLKGVINNGTVVDYLLTKLVGYNEGIGEQANSFKGLTTSIGETGKQLSQVATEGAFQAIESGLKELKEGLKDPSIKQDAATLGKAVGGITSELIHLAASAVEHRDELAHYFTVAQGPAAVFLDMVAKAKDAFGGNDNAAQKALSIGEDRIEINRKLIDQADNEEKKSLIRNNLARQLLQVESSIADSQYKTQHNGKDVAYDTDATAELRKQQFLVQDQLNFLDQTAGKYQVVATKVSEVVHLSAEQKKELEGINAELDKRNIANSSLTEQERSYQQALDETIRKASEQTGISVEILSGLRTRQDIEEANLGLNERQTLELTKQVLAIATAEDAHDKVAAKLETAVKKEGDAYDKAKKVVVDTNAELSKQKIKLDDLAASDRPNKEQEITVALRAQSDALEKQRAALAEIQKIEGDRKKRNEEANPTATANRDRAQAALDNDPLAGDLSPAEEAARADRRAAARAERDRQQRILNNDPNETDTSGDTGPLSDANFQDTAASRVTSAAATVDSGGAKVAEAADTLNTAADAFGGHAAAFSAAVAAIPDSLAPLGEAVATLNADTADLVSSLIDVVDGQKQTIAGLQRQVEALYNS